MDDEWNNYLAKKQEKCYYIMLYSFMLTLSAILITASFQITIIDHPTRIVRDLLLSFGMAILTASIASRSVQWRPMNRHNHQT